MRATINGWRLAPRVCAGAVHSGAKPTIKVAASPGAIWNGNPYCYPGSVLYLPGYPGTGATIYDFSGQGNDGTITGTLWNRETRGIWSLVFNATDNEIVTVGKAASINDLANATYIMWVKTNGPVNYDRFFDKSGATASPTVLFAFRTGGYLHYRHNWSGNDLEYVSNNRAISNLVWTHVALAVTGATARIYTNGGECTYALTTPGTGTLDSDAGNDLCIGAREFSAITAEMKGSIASFECIPFDIGAAKIMDSYQNERHFWGV